jgi:hypothetical protein
MIVLLIAVVVHVSAEVDHCGAPVLALDSRLLATHSHADCSDMELFSFHTAMKVLNLLL